LARYDVATLAVKLTADAQGFEKTLQGAERKMNTFATKITSPLNALRGFGSGISDSIGKPFGTLLTDVTRFTSLIPGLGAASAAMAHPIQAANEAMDRLDKLEEASARIGIDPQFLRGMQIAAEGEAGAIESVMSKLLRFQGQLKQNSTDLTRAGGSSAGKIAERLGLNVEEWSKANPEQLFKLFAARVQEAAGANEEFAVAADIAGRGASSFMNTLRNPQLVEQYTQAVRESNVATKESVALATMWDDLKKKVSLHHESAQEKMIGSGGLLSMGLDQLGIGDVSSGLNMLRAGAHNWVRQAMGGEAKLPADIASEALNEAMKSVRRVGDQAMETEGSDWKAIRQANADMDALVKQMQQTGEMGGEMSATTFNRLAQIVAAARGALKKVKPGDPDDQSKTPEKIPADAMQWWKQNEQLGRDADTLRQSLLSPAEKTEQELLRIQSMMGTNAIDDETYLRALKNLEKGLESPKLKGAKEADVDLAGGQEWARAFNRTSEGIEDKTEDQLKEKQKHTTLLQQIRDEIRLTKPKVLSAPP
jgi:hypothetical protein